jgi:hypothetical protein
MTNIQAGARAALLVTLTTALVVHAQVAARHVEEVPRDDHHFKSPMQLDIPLLVSDPSRWDGSQVRGENLSGYVCDGVSITDFAAEATRGRNGPVTVKLLLVLYAEQGIDKRVDLSTDIMRGDTRIGQTSKNRIKLGEKKHVTRTLEMVIPAETLAAEPRPVVRLTIAVRDDP